MYKHPLQSSFDRYIQYRLYFRYSNYFQQYCNSYKILPYYNLEEGYNTLQQYIHHYIRVHKDLLSTLARIRYNQE